VRLLTGQQVSAIEGEQRVSGVLCADGSLHPADLVIVAIGQVPRLGLAQQLGCVEEAGGVRVDTGLKTSVDGVWAVGDIAAFPSRWADEERIRVEHAAVAIGHGQVAAEQIATGEGSFDDLPTFWSDQGEMTFNVLGVIRPDDEVIWRGDTVTPACTAFYLRDGRLRAALSVGDMKTLRATRKLFAAGVSPSAADLVDPGVDLAALAAGG
jgi:3-phenylpropionate/trans-cinnamate dioxygenase ferredoxin reductase subunit